MAHCLAAPTERHQKCMEMILDRKPDINTAGPTGRTAIYEACLDSKSNEDSILRLLANGADPNCIDKVDF